MKSVIIEGALRTELGSKEAKALRSKDLVPCVIYGGEAPIHFSAPTKAFKDLVYTPEAKMAAITVDGKTVNAVMQDIQFHPVTDEILHIDFIQLIDGKPVTVEIPVNLIGVARGVRNGGKMKVVIRKVKVKATPDNLPDGINLNIENLRIGQAIRVNQVPSEGFEILNAANAVIVSIKTSRNAVADVDDEEEVAEEAAAE
ncbi:MAG: 50S ribosomal protein L25/general stress protein Ctc [Schleiferiaceae bacterium]|nr:50S ribosomal protein L25/general stress protein Ctc [Schleiferiaceae bacterium]